MGSRRKVKKIKEPVNKITREEHSDLYGKVEWEGGIWAYLAEYGPDWKLIEKLGFDKTQIDAAVSVLQELEAKIYEAEDWASEDDDE